jgi:hypothetical protein
MSCLTLCRAATAKASATGSGADSGTAVMVFRITDKMRENENGCFSVKPKAKFTNDRERGKNVRALGLTRRFATGIGSRRNSRAKGLRFSFKNDAEASSWRHYSTGSAYL